MSRISCCTCGRRGGRRRRCRRSGRRGRGRRRSAGRGRRADVAVAVAVVGGDGIEAPAGRQISSPGKIGVSNRARLASSNCSRRDAGAVGDAVPRVAGDRLVGEGAHGLRRRLAGSSAVAGSAAPSAVISARGAPRRAGRPAPSSTDGGSGSGGRRVRRRPSGAAAGPAQRPRARLATARPCERRARRRRGEPRRRAPRRRQCAARGRRVGPASSPDRGRPAQPARTWHADDHDRTEPGEQRVDGTDPERSDSALTADERRSPVRGGRSCCELDLELDLARTADGALDASDAGPAGSDPRGGAPAVLDGGRRCGRRRPVGLVGAIRSAAHPAAQLAERGVALDRPRRCRRRRSGRRGLRADDAVRAGAVDATSRMRAACCRRRPRDGQVVADRLQRTRACVPPHVVGGLAAEERCPARGSCPRTRCWCRPLRRPRCRMVDCGRVACRRPGRRLATQPSAQCLVRPSSNRNAGVTRPQSNDNAVMRSVAS